MMPKIVWMDFLVPGHFEVSLKSLLPKAALSGFGQRCRMTLPIIFDLLNRVSKAWGNLLPFVFFEHGNVGLTTPAV